MDASIGQACEAQVPLFSPSHIIAIVDRFDNYKVTIFTAEVQKNTSQK